MNELMSSETTIYFTREDHNDHGKGVDVCVEAQARNGTKDDAQAESDGDEERSRETGAFRLELAKHEGHELGWLAYTREALQR